ncbi:GIY-YIG nuclease family protein [Parvularcula dongshanensis]|uniref:Putative endonuclease n=1 Tax=Parvularcula dongshanensis TaxID=1173995 RepID=A0A840I4F5_9PROT|nr:GIY-YIG nuclease family protein [Parvularcula dongshanensis]MBB4659161.1 putative endonuclease [Parvularcula dongshanensis]
MGWRKRANGHSLPFVADSFVTIMANRRNGTLYTGVTGDLPRRVGQHRAGAGSTFCARWGCTRLVWYGRFERIADAIAHEKRVKKWPRAYKLNLIEAQNPDWRDLWWDLGGWTG